MLLLIIAALSLTLLTPNLLTEYAEAAKPFHEWCVSSVPESRHLDFYRSILCGVSGRRNECNSIFLELGLIHLILITTHHLQIFDRLLNVTAKLWGKISQTEFPLQENRFPRVILRVGIFGLFALFGGGKVYLARAWFNVVLRELNSFFHLGWRPVQRITFSALVCLLFCSSEIDARALTIGWVASLAFAVSVSFWQFSTRESGDFFRHPDTSSRALLKKFFLRQLSACGVLYLFLLPLFISTGWPSLWIVLTNSVLAPLLSHVLFPIAFLFWNAPILREPIDLAVDRLLNALNIIASQMPESLHLPLAKDLLASGSSRVLYSIALSILALILEDLFLLPNGYRQTTTPSHSTSPLTDEETQFYRVNPQGLNRSREEFR